MGRKHKFKQFAASSDDNDEYVSPADLPEESPQSTPEKEQGRERREGASVEWSTMKDQDELSADEEDITEDNEVTDTKLADASHVDSTETLQNEKKHIAAEIDEETQCTPTRPSGSECERSATKEQSKTPQKVAPPARESAKKGAKPKATERVKYDYPDLDIASKKVVTPSQAPATKPVPAPQRETTPKQNSTERVGDGQRWQELAAEAAGAEIEAMHWHEAGSAAAAAECYCQVAVKLLQAAESLDKDQAVRRVLEQRATEALERVSSLEASQSSVREEPARRDKAMLTTQGILASTLASTASTDYELDDPTCKSSLKVEDAKILGTAATLGGAAGMILTGPLSAAALGAMAAYATTKEDASGAAARKVCTTSIGIADSAMNKAMGTGLKAAEFALEEGRRRLLEGINGSASPAGKSSVVMDWCRANKDKCIRAVAALEALQRTLPRRKQAEEARRMKTRYPDRVPVLCERTSGARSDLPDIERNKFAVPESMRFGEFKYIIHKEVTQASRGLSVDETIYLFVGEPGVQPRTSATMGDLYKLHGGEDFLYIRYTAENTLG